MVTGAQNDSACMIFQYFDFSVIYFDCFLDYESLSEFGQYQGTWLEIVGGAATIAHIETGTNGELGEELPLQPL